MTENRKAAMDQANEITRAISAAAKASETAERAYTNATEMRQEAEVAESTAEGPAQMQEVWNQEREAFSAADAAAEAAMQAGKAAAKYVDHPGLGSAAMAATMQAFQTARSWLA